MDETHRPTDRWLPLLGGLLVVEAVIAVLPSTCREGLAINPFGTGFKYILVYYVICALLPGLLGGATLVASRRPAGRQLPSLLIWLAALAILGNGIPYLFQLIEYSNRMVFLPFFGYLSSLLQELAAPALWGAALLRRDEPGNFRLQKLGRVSAGLVQLGFVLLFVSEMQSWSSYGFLNSSDPGTGAVFALIKVSELAGRLLLLWCSIQSVRSSTDESVIRLRARKIHQLMTAWMWLMGLTMILWIVYGRLQSQGSAPTALAYEFWRGAVTVTTILAATFLVAGRFRTAAAP
jgi:hypothetical protein